MSRAAALPPAHEALAYRIWGVAKPLEWDVSISQLADTLKADRRTVQSVLQMKGWLNRTRATAQPGYRVRDDEVSDVFGGSQQPAWQDPRQYEEAME
jgi:hypothetical protein